MTPNSREGSWVAYLECLDPTTRVPRRFYLADGHWVADATAAERFSTEDAALQQLHGAHLGTTKVGTEQA